LLEIAIEGIHLNRTWSGRNSADTFIHKAGSEKCLLTLMYSSSKNEKENNSVG
jgi:hypothetical protein